MRILVIKICNDQISIFEQIYKPKIAYVWPLMQIEYLLLWSYVIIITKIKKKSLNWETFKKNSEQLHMPTV